MGEFVIKTAPDEDLYLIWSTVVDSAIWVGDRAELMDYLWHEYRRDHPECTPLIGAGPGARVARADATGSSAIDPWVYRWDDEALSVREAAPHDGRWYELPRTNLVAYARAILAEDEAAQHSLLRVVTE